MLINISPISRLSNKHISVLYKCSLFNFVEFCIFLKLISITKTLIVFMDKCTYLPSNPHQYPVPHPLGVQHLYNLLYITAALMD